MSALWLDAAEIAERQRAAAGADAPFAPLVASLVADLAPVVARPVWIPETKARLTRVGGTCPRDGARLDFDPFAPRAHRCPACGATYARDEDHQWWAFGYQLWLAERAVQAAAIALVLRAEDAAMAKALGTFASAVLDAQAAAYLRYPNVDNALGPTRPFFSTYLESLWLVHVCTTLDLLRSAAPGHHDARAARVCARVVEPSRALIAGFPEGTSNRQVWHAVARLAAARTVGDDRGARDAVRGPYGLTALLRTALLADGSWYEGDNYHQFAHRGFWYGLRMAARADIEVAPELVARFRAGYAVPFRVALPDGTLPARRDAQYGVSLRQWRWAEWCELGVADDADPRVRGALAALYAPADPPLPHRTGRWRATGESERNEPASALSRADLGWKSLLFARPHLPPSGPATAPFSELLDDQGLAILRRGDGRVYAALDYGGGGGGHGHPDVLNVILQDGDTRWLDDPGTGTYVESTLHWYRSTLAHAAPLVDGRSQPADTRGSLVSFDPGDAAEFARVVARATVGRVDAFRTVIASGAYVVDTFVWAGEAGGAERLRTVDLPLLCDGALAGPPREWTPFDPAGGVGLEDGFAFVRDAESVALDADAAVIRIAPYAERATGSATLWVIAPQATLWRAVAPGPPGMGARRFHAVRTAGFGARVTAVWDFRGSVTDVRATADEVVVEHADGRLDVHDGLTVVPAPQSTPPPRSIVEPPAARGDASHGQRLSLSRGALHFDMGERHYLRSEATWRDAGMPTATVAVAVAAGALTIDVDVRLGRAPAFAARGAVNVLDNERADVNSDGLQLLVAMPGADPEPTVWLLVPEHPVPTVRVTRVSGAAQGASLIAEWDEQPHGWRVTCRIPRETLGSDRVALDVAVNEKPPDRERRRGQLRLGESDGAFVYLRGDRMDVAGALWFQLPPGP